MSAVRVTVIGIGADGWTGLGDAHRRTILDAEVVLGGARHLAMLPARVGQVREPWPFPLRSWLPELLGRYDGRRVVALASGDPLVSGIGSTLLDLLGADAVLIEPAVSSVSLARARMGWSSDTHDVVSVVSRDAHRVLRVLAPGHRLLVLSSDERSPGEVGRLLESAGYGGSRMTVLSDLGGADEQRVVDSADHWAAGRPVDVQPLNVIAIELDGPLVGPLTGGLPDGAFDHDGQLTKRDLRASALARLAPQPGQLLWDVGAGAGSLSIEWMRAHPTCRAIAVEARDDRAKRIAGNAARLGVPGLRVVLGHAPQALADLPTPDAIFVGGGATEPDVLENCLAALGSGGRLVVHGVTLETERALAERYGALGGELSRIHVEHAAPIGLFTGWTPARSVTQWSFVK